MVWQLDRVPTEFSHTFEELPCIREADVDNYDLAEQNEPEMFPTWDDNVDFEPPLRPTESIDMVDLVGPRSSPVANNPPEANGARYAAEPHDSSNDHPLPVQSEAPLPPTVLAHFLSVLFTTTDPFQALLELGRQAPSASRDLIDALEYHDVRAPSEDTLSSLSITEELDHVASALESEGPLPNILGTESIGESLIRYSPEKLRYLYTGIGGTEDSRPQSRIDVLKDGPINYDVHYEFDVDSIVLLSEHLDVFQQSILWYPAQVSLGPLTTDLHLKPGRVEFHDSHGRFHQHRQRQPYPTPISLLKREFWTLFWAAFEASFSPENIASGRRRTGLLPFDPEVVLSQIAKIEEEDPDTGSDTADSIALQKPTARELRRLVDNVVDKSRDSGSGARKLKSTLGSLQAEVELLRSENQGLRETIIHEKQRRQRGKALKDYLFDRTDPNSAQVFSPAKIAQARLKKAVIEAKKQEEALQRETEKTQRQQKAAAQKAQVLERRRQRNEERE
ncbi:DDE superfamily endonuclease, CENP-B-like protein [Pochonia chlamydosporia 170]|uniref:DDE superfamily endonuclease, CENP-B-like protein n=1 Tax=Pochonia chlamydosporia 170 TaxID=1380566 RepID=A0A179EZW8_METCM|nr:DDE superfamily endonuclease, CENP-B-like protein [Pochonia chlamydosporia 170]OAQ58449.1 DDE superfamily endonuclease, CENP-B-like protein [Pochonia chlamydosporia 170]